MIRLTLTPLIRVKELHRFIQRIFKRQTALSVVIVIAVFSLRTAEAFAIEIVISWKSPKTTGIISGYNIYYGTTSRHYDSVVAVPNVTSAILTDNFIEGLTYYFALTTLNTDGNEGPLSTEASIKVLTDPPVVYFSSSAISGSVPFIVNFFDESLHGPDSWLWNFGDGTTSSMRNPFHVYGDPGVYSVTLTAANDLGSDTFVQPAYVDTTPCMNFPVKNGAIDNQTLQGAYDEALDGECILSQAKTFYEELVMDRKIAITLRGGYDCQYEKAVLGSKINGKLIIRDGALTVQNIIIQ